MPSDDVPPALIDELLKNNDDYAVHRFPGLHVIEPERHLAIVACMDSRMDIFGMLGLHSGDAHVIRNAGGVVTDDVIRSLLISQRLLHTRAIVLIHHTDCGLQKVTDDELKDRLQAETGIRPAFAIESFRDPYVNVRQSMARLQLTPFLPHKDVIRGFVYDVDTGRLNEVFDPE